jgi:glutamate-1-semialdehyde aminotransferase
MSDSQLREYYSEYCNLLKDLNDTTHAVATDRTRTAEQAATLLQTMTIEARCLDDPDKKDEWKQRIQLYKRQLETVQSNNREYLFSKHENATTNNTTTTRSDDTTRLALLQNERLQAARRSVQETEEIAAGIVDELTSNRATLESSRNRTTELRELTQQADGLLTNMLKPWWKRGR